MFACPAVSLSLCLEEEARLGCRRNSFNKLENTHTALELRNPEGWVAALLIHAKLGGI